jgi:voltage-gated potassium channel
VANPLLAVFRRLLGQARDRDRPTLAQAIASDLQTSATIFLVLRRMRVPLIVLILIYAISVLGLTLVPGRTDEGLPYRMGFFEAFYFFSYTATTIGFGEIPYAFTGAQRLWVTLSIYLTVIGWAYAIGTLLTLVQDQSFRRALSLQHFERKVRRLSEPFLLIGGYGKTGELLADSFDALGRRFVVLDASTDRIDALDLAHYSADAPGLVGDVRDPQHLLAAGLGHPGCEAVLALTDSDEANLAMTQAASLLRPDLPVVARATSPAIARRMQAFGTPTVVNPFDRFGNHLRLALRSPASYQLLTWLEAGPGAEVPPRGRPPTHGRWVVCGYGRFGREIVKDLRIEGQGVTVIDPGPPDGDGIDRGGLDEAVAQHEAAVVVGDGSRPAVLAEADLEGAVGFIAGTDNDTTNLSLVAAARWVNPSLFIAARQNRPANAPLFAAVHVDRLLVPTEVVAHEVYAQLSTPLLWRFLQEMPARGNTWAAELVERLVEVGTPTLQALWKVRLLEAEAPALRPWLAGDGLRLGDLLRSPDDRDETLEAVVLLVFRERECVLTPDPDFRLLPGDQLLLAGRNAARRLLETTLLVDATAAYVVADLDVPSGWVWRKLARRTAVTPT